MRITFVFVADAEMCEDVKKDTHQIEDAKLWQTIRHGILRYGFMQQISKYFKSSREELLSYLQKSLKQDNLEECKIRLFFYFLVDMNLRIDIDVIKALNFYRMPWPKYKATEAAYNSFLRQRKEFNRKHFCQRRVLDKPNFDDIVDDYFKKIGESKILEQSAIKSTSIDFSLEAKMKLFHRPGKLIAMERSDDDPRIYFGIVISSKPFDVFFLRDCKIFKNLDLIDVSLGYDKEFKQTRVANLLLGFCLTWKDKCEYNYYLDMENKNNFWRMEIFRIADKVMFKTINGLLDEGSVLVFNEKEKTYNIRNLRGTVVTVSEDNVFNLHRAKIDEFNEEVRINREREAEQAESLQTVPNHSRNKRRKLNETLEIGDRVMLPNEPSLGGTVADIKDNKVSVLFDNDSLKDYAFKELRTLRRKKGFFKKGQRIETLFFEGWYSGKIIKIDSSGKYHVNYDDGDIRKDVLSKNIRIYKKK